MRDDVVGGVHTAIAQVVPDMQKLPPSQLLTIPSSAITARPFLPSKAALHNQTLAHKVERP